jgi:hypothetical protein
LDHLIGLNLHLRLTAVPVRFETVIAPIAQRSDLRLPTYPGLDPSRTVVLRSRTLLVDDAQASGHLATLLGTAIHFYLDGQRRSQWIYLDLLVHTPPSNQLKDMGSRSNPSWASLSWLREVSSNDTRIIVDGRKYEKAAIGSNQGLATFADGGPEGQGTLRPAQAEEDQ